MANGFNPDNPEMARSPNHPYNQHPSTERHPSYENIHLNYNNNHMAPPMPPPPPPPQQQQQQQQQQQPLSHLRESNGHLQSQPYYHPSEYPYPHPPPSQSQPVRWASQLPETPNHPPPNHPPPSRFIEEYSVNQSSQQKSLHYPSRNDESKNNKYMSANTPQYRNDTDNTAHSSPPVLGRSTSPGGSSMSRISPSDHNSASPGASSGMPNKPNTLFSMQITNKPATKATPLMISDEASAMEIGSEHDSVPAIISPASDMDTETPTTSSLRTSPIPGPTARFYPAASNGPPGPPMASTMSQGAVYSVTTEPIMRNSLYMEDRWTEMVRMQREHEHAQFELLERNRRELIAYVEKQHEVSQLQEERRWQRIVDLDIAREKKFCEREERLIATLEAADSRREKHIIDIEKRLREDADAREAHWKQTLTELSNQQTTCYTHMCELLALRKPDLTHKSAMATALTVVSTNENSNDGTVSPL
ncbi:hypothetical protein BDF19DRAFT_413772 [Syncephalis fuscata]|nr:hypothetical protein BDF19DRAFT_413772 [Syncephalis fuscata]